MLKKYRFGFDLMGLLLFAMMLLPTLIWSVFPAPCDVLRAPTATPVLDAVASLLQVAMVAALTVLIRRDLKLKRCVPHYAGMFLCLACYYLCWFLYYLGNTAPLVLLGMTIPPCLGFVLFAWQRRNIPALLLSLGFLLCHTLHCVLNFL
jgi:hypothetical protein